MLLAPQVPSGGRTGCVPLAFADYKEIEKQANKINRRRK